MLSVRLPLPSVFPPGFAEEAPPHAERSSARGRSRAGSVRRFTTVLRDGGWAEGWAGAGEASGFSVRWWARPALSTPSSVSSRARRSAKPGESTPRGRAGVTGVSYAIRPSRITRARSASSSASSTSWVTSSTAHPRRCQSSATSCWALMRVRASRAPKGSSSSRRSGSRARARASEARWASPPDNVFGHAPARPASPTSANARSATGRSGFPGSPSRTLRQTRFQGISRGAWKATARWRGPGRCPRSPGPTRPAPAAEWTCRSRCVRAAR